MTENQEEPPRESRVLLERMKQFASTKQVASTKHDLVAATALVEIAEELAKIRHAMLATSMVGVMSQYADVFGKKRPSEGEKST